jgi:hypothetical protein
MPISNWASFNLIGTRGSDSASKWQFHRREEFSGAPSFFFLSFFLILDKKFLLAVSRWFCCFCAVFEGYFGKSGCLEMVLWWCNRGGMQHCNTNSWGINTMPLMFLLARRQF